MLRLRPYKNCDADIIASWIKNEYAFRQWSADRYERYPVTGADINAHYAGFADADWFYPMTAFDETGVVGHLIMRFTDEEKKILRFGFVIVDVNKRGKGYGREMLSLALQYAVLFLRAGKVTLGVFENNPAAYYCYKAAGFQDVPTEQAEYYHVLGEDWKCLEMERTL
jgi:RimJ/RimL family protein N-acetyltransferase